MLDKRISNFEQIAYVRRYTLRDGKESGTHLIEVNNSKLRFIINESKGLDIYQLWHNGTNISFLSKNGLTDRYASFSQCFEGGMLYTCGLDSLGVREGYPVHGSFHSIPANVIQCQCDESGIAIRATICDSALFGKNLVMHREITTTISSDTLVITDTLENRGTRTADYCLLYHVNIGYPMLDDDVKIAMDTESVIPRTSHSEKHLSERDVFLPPVDNEEERCYFLKLKKPEITVINGKIRKAFKLRYSRDTLPYCIQWYSNASHDYALGIEPTTSLLDDLFTYRQLQPGEMVSFSLELSVKDF